MDAKKTYLALCQDESLAEHDRRFHGGMFDPATMRCSKRERELKKDLADDLKGGDSGENGYKGVFDNWIPGLSVTVVSPEKADIEYAKIEENGGDVRRAILTKEKLSYYANAIGPVIRAESGELAIPPQQRFTVMDRIPAVVDRCADLMGFKPKPKRVRITYGVLDKCLDHAKDSRTNFARRMRLADRILDEHPGMSWGQACAMAKKDDHKISLSDIKKIPQLLDNPVAVFRDPLTMGVNARELDTMVVLTDAIDGSNGERAMLMLRYKHDDADGDPILEVMTMYGKNRVHVGRNVGDTIDYMNRSGDLLYLNGKKFKELYGDDAKFLEKFPVLGEDDLEDLQLGDVVDNCNSRLSGEAIRPFYGKDKKVAGWYDRERGDVKLVRGRYENAIAAHEIGWHATYHWCEKHAPELYQKLREYAQTATPLVRQSVIDAYGREIGDEELLDEIGAERFTREFMKATDEDSETWWNGVGECQDRARKAYVDENEKDVLTEKEINKIAALPPDQAVRKLIAKMLLRKRLWNEAEAKADKEKKDETKTDESKNEKTKAAEEDTGEVKTGDAMFAERYLEMVGN